MKLARNHRINGKYTLGPQLGRGGFSAVYLATDDKGNLYAVKTEQRDKQTALIGESDVYKRVRKEAERNNGYPLGIPRMHYFDDDFHGHRVLVMDCLGKSIGDRLRERGAPLSVKTVLMIGIQAVSRLEYIHRIGVIHRDVKPENLLTGTGSRRNRIYLSDFGLANTYIDRSGRHISESQRGGFCGTYMYASRHAHRKMWQTRRSDLESLAYTLVYLGKRHLPWIDLGTRDMRKVEHEIREIKESVSAKQICTGLPSAFTEFVGYVRGLGFSQKPDYQRLRNMLLDELKKRGESNDSEFDWMKG